MITNLGILECLFHNSGHFYHQMSRDTRVLPMVGPDRSNQLMESALDSQQNFHFFSRIDRLEAEFSNDTSCIALKRAKYFWVDFDDNN